MKTISINTSGQYEVHIGSGLLNTLPDITKSITKAKTLCIVSDSNVWPLYGDRVVHLLRSNGYHIISFVIQAGEISKNGENFLALLNFLAEQEITRSDALIALGGGVVGDLTGFAAATYLRGIDYIQIPTTLLAAVDSSVGGKTAIDLPAGKNLAGAFYQPKAVVCDTDTLNTLPIEVLMDGCAEVNKYGILYDQDLFHHMETYGFSFDKEKVISCCVELKRDVVAEDEYDRGQRMMLNLGHTIGHAVERCSQYEISHGKAVAIGTSIVARASMCSDQKRIVDCLSNIGLPVTTDYSAEALFNAALHDKKRADSMIHLIIPRAIGQCEICPTPVGTLKSFIQAGL